MYGMLVHLDANLSSRINDFTRKRTRPSTAEMADHGWRTI